MADNTQEVTITNRGAGARVFYDAENKQVVAEPGQSVTATVDKHTADLLKRQTEDSRFRLAWGKQAASKAVDVAEAKAKIDADAAEAKARIDAEAEKAAVETSAAAAEKAAAAERGASAEKEAEASAKAAARR